MVLSLIRLVVYLINLFYRWYDLFWDSYLDLSVIHIHNIDKYLYRNFEIFVEYCLDFRSYGPLKCDWFTAYLLIHVMLTSVLLGLCDNSILKRTFVASEAETTANISNCTLLHSSARSRSDFIFSLHISLKSQLLSKNSVDGLSGLKLRKFIWTFAAFFMLYCHDFEIQKIYMDFCRNFYAFLSRFWNDFQTTLFKRCDI